MTEESQGSTGEGTTPEEGVVPEPGTGSSSAGESGSFGDAAAEMANETEVEGRAAEGDELIVTRMELEERTRDLQRLQAEYLN